MAPHDHRITYGTVGPLTVSAFTRKAAVNEEHHLDYVTVVHLSSDNGLGYELAVRPSHPQGIAEANIAGHAVLKALQLGERA